MDVLPVLLLLLASLVCSECVRCFARFDPTSGQCDVELGEADKDDCCQNPSYGYQDSAGSCQYCGPAVWSLWSQWSRCTTLCGRGVRQRSRGYYGFDQSTATMLTDKLETEPCNGTCCDGKGWNSWSTWSSCSVSCGEGAVRNRARVCSSPECELACTGPAEEVEVCPSVTCPVHGGFSSWSSWTKCSGPCVGTGAVPYKTRDRSCTNPAPSTAPPGNACHGDKSQTQMCTEMPNCPVHGSWGAWSSPGPCSSSCGTGLQTSTRLCDNPAPKYGGRFCEGVNSRTQECESSCPVDGVWAGWSSWGECSASCSPQGAGPVRTRSRSCSNPPPSTSPAGRRCEGQDQQTEICSHLPPCVVHGGWTSWSTFDDCSVSCGVGIQVSQRSCTSPAPKHGGHQCDGPSRKTRMCSTGVHCPVNGVWKEWSAWGPCQHAHRDRSINCKQVGGKQTRERWCLHQAFNGSFCDGINLVETQVCYDVNHCEVEGTWGAWDSWSLCRPPCGSNSRRVRLRICDPDYSKYNPTIGRQREEATFFGKPIVDCGPLPAGENPYEIEMCENVPPCPAKSK